MSVAIYPGSFDPITLGHVDIIKRLSPLYSRFIVLAGEAESKSNIFSASERVELIKQSLKGIVEVEVESFSGLTVDYAEKVGANVIIRGIRGVGDMENEMAMAHLNRKLKSNIETLIVLAAPEYTSLSSRFVKEIARNKGDLSHFVSSVVADALVAKLNT